MQCNPLLYTWLSNHGQTRPFPSSLDGAHCSKTTSFPLQNLDRHVPQLEFLNLAARRLGIVVDPKDVFRDQMARQLGPHPLPYDILFQNLVSLAGVLAVVPFPPAMRHDEGGHGLAQPLVGHAHDAHLHDAVQLEEAVLDLERVDVLAAADNEVLDAAGDGDEALLVHLGLVARVHPGGEAGGAVEAGLGDADVCGAGVVAKVALHDEVAGGGELAGGVEGREAGAVAGVDDLDGGVGHRGADRGGPAVRRVGRRRHAADGRGLGHAVADDEVAQPEAAADRLHEGLGHRGARGDALAQVGGRAGHGAGVEGLEHRDEHGAHAVQARGVVVGAHAQRGDGVEGRAGEQDGAACRRRRHVPQDAAEAVEQRGRHDDAVRGLEAHAVGDEDAVVEDGPVAEHGGLGHRRGARRELDVDGVGGIQRRRGDDAAVGAVEERAVGRQRAALVELEAHVLVGHAVVHDDDALEAGHALALGRGRAQVARDAGQQLLVAAALAGLVGQVGDGAHDEHLGGEVLERGFHLGRVEGRVERHQDRAQLEAGVGEGGELGRVALRYGHAVALLDTQARERRGQPVREQVQHVVCEGCLEGSRRGGPRDDGRAVAVKRDDLRKMFWDRAHVQRRL